MSVVGGEAIVFDEVRINEGNNYNPTTGVYTGKFLAQTDPDLQIAGYKFRAQEMSASSVVFTRFFFEMHENGGRGFTT